MKETKLKLTNSRSQQIAIGRTGEHDVARIILDISHYIDLYGDVSASVVVSESVFKQGYPIPCTQDGATVTIPVTDALTRRSVSYMEVRMSTGDGLAKSEMVKIICTNALPDAVGDAPTPIADWIDNAENLLRNLNGTAVVGMYGSNIAPMILEVIGVPEYIGEDEIGEVNGYDIAKTGWYSFARITADNGVYVGSGLIVDGVEDYKAGVNYIDVAVRFGTNGDSTIITINWDGNTVNQYLFRATDLAIRNLDYRSTYRVYDIGDCLSFTTSGTKKAVFQNLTRNIVYAVDAIDCPMVVHLPDVSTESFGTWIELRVELTTSTNVSLEFVPPGNTKLSGTNVNVPKEGLNIIMAQYHEKMNTWFISNTVWAKPK